MSDESIAGIQKLIPLLAAEIEAIVERKIEEKFPEIIRAIGISDTSPAESETELVGAVEVARLLGRDITTPEKVLQAKKHVYNLARKKLIPSVRVSPRCVKFDLNAVRRVIAQGGNAEPYSKAA
jgi:hypothetical protein